MASQQEEARKQQRRGEIIAEINARQTEINNLVNSRNAYESMKGKINQAIPKLTSAKKYVNNSQTNLKSVYTGKEATKENAKFQEVIQGINDVIGKLNNPVIAEINRKINSINQEIIARQNRIGQLQNEFYSLYY